MSLNIKEARQALDDWYDEDTSKNSFEHYVILEDFINAVEKLMAFNSIKQVPVLFQPKGS